MDDQRTVFCAFEMKIADASQPSAEKAFARRYTFSCDRAFNANKENDYAVFLPRNNSSRTGCLVEAAAG
jgi:hypothetical protein